MIFLSKLSCRFVYLPVLFPESFFLSWPIAYFEIGKISESKIYTIDTVFQNIYLYDLLFDREMSKINNYEHGYDMLKFAKSIIMDCKKSGNSKLS